MIVRELSKFISPSS